MSLSKTCEVCLVERASCRWGDVLPSGPAGPRFSVDQHLEICPSEARLPIWIFVYWVGSGELASALATTSSCLPFSESTLAYMADHASIWISVSLSLSPNSSMTISNIV